MYEQGKVEQVENEFIAKIRERLKTPEGISGPQQSSVLSQDVEKIRSSLITPSTPSWIVDAGIERAITKLGAEGVRLRADGGFTTLRGRDK